MKKLLITLALIFGLVLSVWGATISDLDEDTSPTTSDLVLIVDVSDNTMSTAGTNKKVLIGDLIRSGLSIYGIIVVDDKIKLGGGVTPFSSKIELEGDVSGWSLTLLSGVTPGRIFDLDISSGVSDSFLSNTGDGLRWLTDSSARDALKLTIGQYVQGYGPNTSAVSAAGSDKLFYTNSSGLIQEVTLGSSGTYLKSLGPGIAPSWGADVSPGGGAGVTWFYVDASVSVGGLEYTEMQSGGTLFISGSSGFRTRADTGGTVYVEPPTPDAGITFGSDASGFPLMYNADGRVSPINPASALSALNGQIADSATVKYNTSYTWTASQTMSSISADFVVSGASPSVNVPDAGSGNSIEGKYNNTIIIHEKNEWTQYGLPLISGTTTIYFKFVESPTGGGVSIFTADTTNEPFLGNGLSGNSTLSLPSGNGLETATLYGITISGTCKFWLVEATSSWIAGD